jgi:ABC-type transport system involved in cytochrome bd biosynthesis fused ATPase/permease subunit
MAKKSSPANGSPQSAIRNPQSAILDEDVIEIIGAREHNLKDISLRIPRNKLVVITGISGSGAIWRPSTPMPASFWGKWNGPTWSRSPA